MTLRRGTELIEPSVSHPKPRVHKKNHLKISERQEGMIDREI